MSTGAWRICRRSRPDWRVPPHRRSGRARWLEYQDQLDSAPLITEGRDLVWRARRLGCPIWYSSTRPAWLRDATRVWLERHDLPDTRQLLLQQNDQSARVLVHQVKHVHCGTVNAVSGQRLALFIDDQDAEVEYLTARGISALLFASAITLDSVELLRTMNPPAGTPPNPSDG